MTPSRILVFLCSCLFIFFSTGIHAQKKWTVKEVPNPKAQPSWNYVSNPDGVLNEGTVAAINNDLKRLEDSTTDQVAVVVLNSIGKKVPRGFATELLRYWGPGQKNKNNGVLILLVMDQRRMEFEVGYGLEGRLTDLVSKQIQERYMVPYAKQGDYNAAVLNGVRQVVQVLGGTLTDVAEPDNATIATAPPEIADIVIPYSDSPFEHSSRDVFTLYNRHVGFGGFWVLLLYGILTLTAFAALFKKSDKSDFFYTARPRWFLILQFLCCYILLMGIVLAAGITITVFTGLIFFYLLGMTHLSFTVFRLLYCLKCEEQKNTKGDLLYLYARQLDQKWKQSIAGKLFPIPLRYYRDTVSEYIDRLKQSTITDDAGERLSLIGEKQDDAYLTDAQKLEEQLKSMDYDVWAAKEGTSFKLHGVLLSSKYSHCPKCHTMAYYLKSNRTIEPATYSSKGVGVKTFECKFCNHQEKQEYTIPRKSQSSSSSGSGSSGSSSSSSGSSWGGGSSGGGGAGSSW